MTRLASSLDRLQPHYDVVVVGSGYGGGVAASRLARAGKRVAVLERGREFVTGEFPARFPDLRGEMQLTGKRLRLGSPTGLYDVRFGEDMHVLVGCGLGGGSLINAGVALRPDPRVFRDPVWPGRDRRRTGCIDEGYARAARWVRPARDPAAAERTKYQGAATARARALGKAPVAAPVVVSFDDDRQSGRHRAARLHALRRLLRRLQRRRQEHGGAHLPARRGAARRRDLHARQGAPRRQGAARAAGTSTSSGRMAAETAPDSPACVTADMVVLAAGTLGSTEILLRSREQGLALSDRLGQRFSANGDIIAFGYGAKLPGQRHRRRPSAQGRGPRRRRLRLRPDRDRRRAGPRQQPHHPGGRAAVGAGADPAGAVHPQRPPARRAARASSPASTRGRSRACRRSLPCRTTAPRAASCWRTTASRSPGPAPRTSRSTSASTRRWRRWCGRPAAATSRTRSPAP